MRRFLLLFLPLSLSAQTFTPDEAKPRELTLDQDSLHVFLQFDTDNELVLGKVDIYASPLERTDSVYLDAKPSIEITEPILFNGEVISFERVDDGLILRPSQDWTSAHIQIEYTARPFKGVYFNGWNDPSGNARKQIFTQGQGIDHRHWLPHQDAQNDKLVTSMTIVFDKKFRVLGNGQLVDKHENEGDISWTYAMDKPHSSYLIAFAIGEYDETVVGENPLRANYMYPDHSSDYESTYYGNEEIWNYLNDRIGYPFVWDAYRQVPVANFPHGAMENTTLTIFSENFICSQANFQDLNYVYVNAHELAHHWFGDLITVPSSHDFWLHEGFATYYQMEAERAVFGDEHYTQEWIEALELIRQARAADSYPLRHSKAGSFRFYQQGALTLRSLEQHLTTDSFNLVMDTYLERYAFGLVTTDSLRLVIEDVCDISMEQWFHSFVESEKTLTISMSLLEDENGFSLMGQQFQEGNDANLNHLQVRVWRNEESFEDFDIRLGRHYARNLMNFDYEPYAIEIDPNHWYLAEWILDLPEEILGHTLEVGTDYSRFLALEAFQKMEEDPFQYSSSDWLEDVEVQAIADLAVELMFENDEDDLAELAESYFASNGIIRKALLKSKANPEIYADITDELISTMKSDETSDDQAFLIFVKLFTLNPREINTYLSAMGGRDGGMDKDVEIYNAYFTTLVKGKSDPDGLPRLLELAGPSFSIEVRMAAWEMLSELKYTEKDLRDIHYLELTSRHRHLKNAAVRYVRGYLESMDRNRIIREMEFVLKNAHPDDIARVERILDIDLEIE
ncbi:MAG: hypothetical protein HWE14_07625 [Flavobacteriia bacterium]|nr:hypothetical protein [Flavobacteriia bacterium]